MAKYQKCFYDSVSELQHIIENLSALHLTGLLIWFVFTEAFVFMFPAGFEGYWQFRWEFCFRCLECVRECMERGFPFCSQVRAVTLFVIICIYCYKSMLLPLTPTAIYLCFQCFLIPKQIFLLQVITLDWNQAFLSIKFPCQLINVLYLIG